MEETVRTVTYSKIGIMSAESNRKKNPLSPKRTTGFRDNDDYCKTCVLSFKQEMPAFLEKVLWVDEFEEDIIKLRESKNVGNLQRNY